MSRFNTPTVGTKTRNLAGGSAYSESPELELVSLLLTSFVQDKFYESAQAQMDRVNDLVSRVDPEFAAKAAIYARNEFGMRSISHVLAVALIPHLKGTDYGRKFYEKVIRRPDDMTEIWSLFLSKRGEKYIPMNMREGFKEAFNKFDNYQLVKWRGEGKQFSLVDLINLVHPVPTQKNAQALSDIVNGKAASTDTWESKLSEAGKSEDKESAKAEAWEVLIAENRLPYFAALRNIRNILEQSPNSLDGLIAILTNEQMIRKSLVFPFRFLVALETLRRESFPIPQKLLNAVVQAVDIAMANVPKLDGKTLVILDESGSMTWGMNRQHNISPGRIGALFAATLVKANDADLMLFDSSARYVNLPPAPVLSQAAILEDGMRGGGTNINSALQLMVDNANNRQYDRVIILSDMQSWMHPHSPSRILSDYVDRTGKTPFVYSFDLQGYGTLQFPERNVYTLAGFSEKVFDVMELLESDRDALINTIKAVEL